MDELPLFYACEHGTSNTPDECHLRAWALTAAPGSSPPQTVPDDWYLGYPSVAGGGMSDGVGLS